MAKSPPTEAELRELLGDADVREFLNPRHALYREREMKTKPPSKEDVIKLVLRDVNLLRRPILVKGKRKVIGFEEARYRDILSA